jgi:hypothetical protein
MLQYAMVCYSILWITGVWKWRIVGGGEDRRHISRGSPLRPQQPAAGAPLPRFRLRLSSRSCHGGWGVYHARVFLCTRTGTEVGGCAGRRTATMGCRELTATAPRPLSALPPFFVRLTARWASRACRVAFFAAPAPLSPSTYTPLPLSAKTKAGGGRNTHLHLLSRDCKIKKGSARKIGGANNNTGPSPIAHWLKAYFTKYWPIA